MKDGIHPKYYAATARCGGCGATFQVGSTTSELTVNICSECHPFYTGTQKLVDTEGRVDRFNKKYAKFAKPAA